MNEYSDFDLDRSTAQAWSGFESRLSEIISVIDDTADMTIGTATAAVRTTLVTVAVSGVLGALRATGPGGSSASAAGGLPLSRGSAAECGPVRALAARRTSVP